MTVLPQPKAPGIAVVPPCTHLRVGVLVFVSEHRLRVLQTQANIFLFLYQWEYGVSLCPFNDLTMTSPRLVNRV